MRSVIAMRVLACAFAAAAVVFALTLVACSGGEAGTSSAESSAPGSETSESATGGTTTLAAIMSDRYASFDKFDEGIQGGEEIPQSLHLFIDGSFDGYVHDRDVIVEYWNALSAIRVDADKATSNASKEGVILFDFDSGKEIIPFTFYTDEYAELDSSNCCPVADPQEVSRLVDSLRELVNEEKEANLGKLVEENGVYLWDADGDGNPEHLDFSYIDNGDEAPSVMVVSLYGFITNVDTMAYIDRAYGVESLECGEDDQGPYVLVSYAQGDYYSHDHVAQCKLRLVKGELVVEELQ